MTARTDWLIALDIDGTVLREDGNMADDV
ncbi:MAG: hypothetical protein JWR53_1689, partial [Glaciihabitans sp.]|nr:hypothetical protein [Glaciihabitans sp.]